MVEIHYNFVFEKQWENVKRFYEWFGLSPDEIKKLKKETVFSDRCGRDMTELLYDEGDILPYLSYLRWCLTDEQIIFDFKKDLEIIFSSDLDHDKHAKERLNHLIEELLSDFKKATENKKTESETLEEEQVVSSKPVKSEEKSTNQLTYFVQTRREKRVHEVTEEESSLSSKRMAK